MFNLVFRVGLLTQGLLVFIKFIMSSFWALNRDGGFVQQDSVMSLP